jgi:hypothetical protein
MELSESDQKRKLTIELPSKIYETLIVFKDLDGISPTVRIQNIIRTLVTEGKIKVHTGL